VMSQLMIAHWVNPVHVLNLEEYIVKRWVKERHTVYCTDRSEPWNPKTKTHTQNQWAQSRQLLKPHQYATCGKQYEVENYDHLQHMENCNHNAVLMSTYYSQTNITRTSR
jgi:hypothetical protein